MPHPTTLRDVVPILEDLRQLIKVPLVAKQDTILYKRIASCADLDVEHGMELLLGVTRGFRKAVTNQRKGILAKANE